MIRLMIKSHNKTGLKYLCVSQKDDYEDYKGSGVYWKKHLKKHGADISTEVLCESKEKDDNFKNVCVFYSMLYNIVDSEEWANLVLENANTSRHGLKDPEHTKLKRANSIKAFYESEAGQKMKMKISEMLKAKWKDQEYSDKRKSDIENSWTEQTFREKQAEASKKYWLVKENHTKASIIAKEKFAAMTADEIKEFGKRMSKQRLNMTEEAKKKRGIKYGENLKHSIPRKKYNERMKKERLGSGNPAAKTVMWKGETFLTKKDFCCAMKERGLSVRRCEEMVNDPSILDCYIQEDLSRTKNTTICPHCGKESFGLKISGMKRYHFDNCKFKKEKNED